MEYQTSHFDQSLQKLKVLFKLSGMNLQNKIKTPSDFLKYRWLFVFNFLWVQVALFGSFYYIIIGIVEGKDVIELTSIAPCTTFSVLSIIKAYYHYMNEAKISKLIESIRKLERDANKKKASVEKSKIIEDHRMFLNRVINVLYVLSCLMIVVFDMMPLVSMAVMYQKTREFEMLLPFLDVFVFLPHELIYWPFAYVHQIWAECVVLLEMGAADYLFFTFCTYISIQFRLLQHDIETMITVNDREVMPDEEFHEKFTELVRRHQEIIESSMTLEAIYSRSNLFNFLSSSLVICLTGFNVTIVKDVVVVMIYMTFLFMGLMQVFFLCWFGDMMTSSSMEVSDAVYNSHWYSTSVAASRGLLLVQTRSQNSCKLTAAGFAEVNLNAFLRVLSSSWSYFALLQTVYGASNKM